MVFWREKGPLIELRPEFIDTKNVRNFQVMVDDLISVGEGCLGCVPGTPGIGKTKTSRVWSARNNGVYLRIASIWKRSELDFMQAMALELGIARAPSRKGRCYMEAVDRLAGSGRVVFLDEMQRLPKEFLNIALDLSDATGCPFVLVGEPELKGLMQENKRVWSRTHRLFEFEPLSMIDVMIFAAKTASLNLRPKIASILHRSSGGDFRIFKRDFIALVKFANAQGPDAGGAPQITEEMARIAVKQGLKGNGNGK
jgi:DNA transposition AAA+ family ATPase